MLNIQHLQIQSLLAQAAYVDLPKGVIDAKLLESDDGGMSSTQAKDFATNWTVIDQFKGGSGVSATIFQEKASGKKYLAIRGTQDLADFGADLILGSGFPAYLNPQFLQLRSQVQTWLNNGSLNNGFTVTGHSLGGYLATAVGTWFSDESPIVYTYNAPGMGGITGNVIDAFKSAFGLGNLPLVANINNIRGTAGISTISGLGLQLSPPIMLETETNINPLSTHSIVNMTDSLSTLSIYAKLDTSLTLAKGNQILTAASNTNSTEREASLDALRKIILGANSTPTIVDDSENFYLNSQILQNSATFKALTGEVSINTNDTPANTAKTDFLAFLSLYYLLPFSLASAMRQHFLFGSNSNDVLTGAGFNYFFLILFKKVWQNLNISQKSYLTT